MPPMPLPTRTWQAPGHPLLLEFPVPVLNAIRVLVRRQFDTRDAPSGDARGAVLGCRGGDTIRITGVTPLQYPVAVDSAQVVGWYALRSAKEICLAEEDLEFMRRPGADHREVVFIFRPVQKDAVRVGIFFRECNGTIRSASSYREFLLTPSDSPDKLIRQESSRPKTQGDKIRGLLSRRTAGSEQRWTSLVFAPLLAAILILIVIIEIIGIRTESNYTPEPHLPVSSNASAADRALVRENKSLTAELQARRDHDRRLELLIRELRDRAASTVRKRPGKKP